MLEYLFVLLIQSSFHVSRRAPLDSGMLILFAFVARSDPRGRLSGEEEEVESDSAAVAPLTDSTREQPLASDSALWRVPSDKRGPNRFENRTATDSRSAMVREQFERIESRHTPRPGRRTNRLLPMQFASIVSGRPVRIRAAVLSAGPSSSRFLRCESNCSARRSHFHRESALSGRLVSIMSGTSVRVAATTSLR